MPRVVRSAGGRGAALRGHGPFAPPAFGVIPARARLPQGGHQVLPQDALLRRSAGAVGATRDHAGSVVGSAGCSAVAVDRLVEDLGPVSDGHVVTGFETAEHSAGGYRRGSASACKCGQIRSCLPNHTYMDTSMSSARAPGPPTDDPVVDVPVDRDCRALIPRAVVELPH